jgi:hypothetical protein
LINPGYGKLHAGSIGEIACVEDGNGRKVLGYVLTTLPKEVYVPLETTL